MGHCSEHQEMSNHVAAVRSLMGWLLLIFCTLLGLVGYNIHITQKIEVRLADQMARLEHELESHEEQLGDHESRLRILETRKW